MNKHLEIEANEKEKNNHNNKSKHDFKITRLDILNLAKSKNKKINIYKNNYLKCIIVAVFNSDSLESAPFIFIRT